MEFQDVISRRHSVRGFTAQPVAREVVERLVATASRSPSWSNVQGWHLAFAGGGVVEAIRRELLAQADGSYNAQGLPQPELPWLWEFPEPLKSRRRDCARRLYEEMGIDYADREGRARAMLRNFSLFCAPHLAVLSSHRNLGHYGLVDAGCFLQSFLLALVNEGLAGCAQAAVASHAPTLRRHLEIPENYWIVCGVAFGYEDAGDPANRTKTLRAPLAEFTSWKGF